MSVCPDRRDGVVCSVPAATAASTGCVTVAWIYREDFGTSPPKNYDTVGQKHAKTASLLRYRVIMEPSGSTRTKMSPSGDLSPNSTEDGHLWEVSDKTRLRRFLCYGSESDTYNAREEPRLSMENTPTLFSLLQEGRGCEVVEEIKRSSQNAHGVRPNPSLFALALCSQHSELKTRQAAFKALKEVCRSPAHLFAFIQYKKELKEGLKCGIWGRALRKAVSDWYNDQEGLSLALAVTTCKQREGWSHQDLLRLSHTKPANETIALITKYVTKGWKEVQASYTDKENSEEIRKVLSYLEVMEKARHSSDEAEVIHLIEEHQVERDQLQTHHLRSKDVWRALLKEMPLASMLRILGKMTADGVLEPGSSDMAAVCERIQSESALKKANIHPFSVLLASESYKRGQGCRGKVKWQPETSILKALDVAFYKCFTNVEPTGKRFLVAVDVSTSLSSVVPGTSVSTVVAAAAVTMMIARTEVDTQVLAYSEGAVVPCPISPDMSLADATVELVKIPSGSTDYTLPITWAMEMGKAVDVFIIFTNNQCWAFSGSPVETLKKHRQKTGGFSKLVMCGLTSVGHSLADTEDRGVLSICGFDVGALALIYNLAQDLI